MVDSRTNQMTNIAGDEFDENYEFEKKDKEEEVSDQEKEVNPQI